MRSHLSWLLLSLLVGCATRTERAVHASVRADTYGLAQARQSHAPADAALLGGGVDGLVAYAVSDSPGLQAAHARVEAAAQRAIAARRPPEPEIMVGYFVRQSEMLIGRERARAGVKQALPWPQGLAASGDAAAAEAEVVLSALDVEVLALRERVAQGWWALWRLRRLAEVFDQAIAAISVMEAAASGAQAAGGAGLSEVQRLVVQRIRAEEARRSLDAEAAEVEAAIVAAVGAPAGAEVPTPGGPPSRGLPVDAAEVLSARAQANPQVKGLLQGSLASEARARSEAVARLPGVVLGAEWMEMAPGVMDGRATPGRDAVMVSLGLRVPLWQRSYTASVRAARAEARAKELDAEVAKDAAAAEVAALMARLHDAHRQQERLSTELLPAAQTSLEAALGGLPSGRVRISDALLSWRDELELSEALITQQARFAATWASLERRVGGPVERRQP